MTADEARRAIYIDFECLKGKPYPIPKLLGVLVADHFEQLVLDPGLRPACVANPWCRVIEPGTAIRELMERAEREGRPIVGWSFFDRDVAGRACPPCKSRLLIQYRNAIQTARPWRQHLHPSVRFEKEDEFAPKHTLDKYAALVGYPHSRALTSATPARWIRETMTRLEKASGRYRALSETGKHDWHRLLEYNWHDCLALQVIATRAAHELQAWRAYERTRFCVEDGTRRVCFKVGTRSARLEALLARHHAPRFAFITAWNPGSVPLDATDNDRRQRTLELELDRLGLRALPGEGIGEDPSSTPERSLMVLNISEGRAVALGTHFRQLAIVFGRRGQPPRLISCAVPGGPLSRRMP